MKVLAVDANSRVGLLYRLKACLATIHSLSKAAIKYINDNSFGSILFCFFHWKKFEQENESAFSCVFLNWSLGRVKNVG